MIKRFQTCLRNVFNTTPVHVMGSTDEVNKKPYIMLQISNDFHNQQLKTKLYTVTVNIVNDSEAHCLEMVDSVYSAIKNLINTDSNILEVTQNAEDFSIQDEDCILSLIFNIISR